MANALYYIMLIGLVFIGIAYLGQGAGILHASAPANNTTVGQQYEQTGKILDLTSALFPAILFGACGFIVWKVVLGGGD